MAKGDTKTNQYLDIAANGTRADLPTDTCCETRSQTLIREVAERIMDVEDEVERLENNPDVVDIVPTYAALQNYDTSSLTDKDIIRVLQDETHDGDSTYYRYNAQSGTWTYVGESKQYEDFVGTDGTAGGQNGLVPAPVATDAGKFLNANGSWEEVQAGPTVVQTTGTSTTDVMSQKAVTDRLFASGHDPATSPNDVRISIGNPGYSGTGKGVTIGCDTQTRTFNQNNVNIMGWCIGDSSVTIGSQAATTSGDRVSTVVGANAKTGGSSEYGSAFGANAQTSNGVNGAVALGAYSLATQNGEVNVGSTVTKYGYNSSNYRLLTGLYDPQSDHDAATKGYVDPTTDSSAPTTATVGRLGQIQIDTTTATAYMCVAVDTVTPSYTWKQITA